MSPSSDPSTAHVLKLFKESERALIALSGGVDSAVLVALAERALGPKNVLAVTTFSASVPVAERRAASRVADFVGVGHHEVPTRELENLDYRRNTGDRCYHCRVEMFETLRRIARERGFGIVAYGAIVDDLGDDRPGMAAAEQLGVRAPLLEAGLTKRDVRAIARRMGLPVSDKPAAACLASRIPLGTEVTEERLSQVDRAEIGLAALGFRQFRVRHHGAIARLELDAEGNRRLQDPELRRRLVAAVRAAGFRFVTVDLEGFRSGSLNVVDPVKQE